MPSVPKPQARYERLLVAGGTELHLALDALQIHPGELAIPSPDAMARREAEDIFAPFHYPKRATPRPVAPALEQERVENPSVPKSVVRGLLAAASTEAEIALHTEDVATQSPTPRQTQYPTAVHRSAIKPPRQLLQDKTPGPELFDLPQETASKSLSREPPPSNPFRTARSRLPSKRTLRGGRGQGLSRPGKQSMSYQGDRAAMAATSAVLGPKRARFSAPRSSEPPPVPPPEQNDVPEIPNVDPKLVEMIMNEMLDRSPGVEWEDIAGLRFAKRCVMEAVVWPMKRPDIFTGLRGPPKGLLLFGPPGTGKTLIGRAIASTSGAKFFNISASSLMSKWVGEGEKMVRALFAVAREFQPSVVFIDEIDSLLTQRTDGEQESSRRVKTEFLVQMDGAGTSREDRVLVVGATNRPQELDEAARRRLVKRLYIPLPDTEARASLVRRLLGKQKNSLSELDISVVADLAKGYSGSDMYALCAEAALGPVRDLGDSIGNVDVDSVRPVCKADFETAIRMVRASVSDSDLAGYSEWNTRFGSFPSSDPSALAAKPPSTEN